MKIEEKKRPNLIAISRVVITSSLSDVRLLAQLTRNDKRKKEKRKLT